MSIENIDKGYKFFAALPDLKQFVKQVETPRTDMIGIIPLFKDPYFNEHNFPAFLKAAIYARQSWLLHTDAIETDTAIKLYIDDTCKDVAIPMCMQNGLDIDTDIIWFNAPPLPDTHLGVWARLGKKMNLYWDPQLSDYDKIVYWDADMFKLKTPPEKSDIFTQVASTERVLSFIRVPLLQRRVWLRQIIQSSVKNVRFGGIPIQDIFVNAELGRTCQEISGPIARPIGGFGIYPARRFHSELRPFVEWQQTHAPYIGDDEICLALGAAKFNIYLRALTNNYETEDEHWHVTHTDINNLSGAESDDSAFVHGKPASDDKSEIDHYTDILKTLVTPDDTPD